MTWRERVQAAREAGFSGGRMGRSSVLCLADEHGVPRPYRNRDQVYPKDDHNTLGIPARNAVPLIPQHLESRLQRAARRVPMSLTVSTSKKRMGPHAYIRKKIVQRLRGVMDLIVSRGAHVVTKETGEPEICLSEEESGRKWSMQGIYAVIFSSHGGTESLSRMDIRVLSHNRSLQNAPFRIDHCSPRMPRTNERQSIHDGKRMAG